MRLNRFCIVIIISLAMSWWVPGLHGDSPQPGPQGRDVNPFIGTGGITYLCGNNFPGGSVPFGMMRISPDTMSASGKKASNSSGYYYHDPKLLGFSHTRLVGTGAVDGGNFLIIPTREEWVKSHRRGLSLPFDHQREVAFPGYYSVEIPELSLKSELTATSHVGVHRHTYRGA